MRALGLKDRKFWDNIADKYFAQPVANEEVYQTKLKMTQTHLKPHMRVFEFGCGTGTTALKHAPFVQSVLATDLAENMLAYGRSEAERIGIQNVEFLCTSIEEYDPKGDLFDVVLALNILHLCRDPQAVMKKAHDMLKPGGLLIQSTACIGNMNPLLRMAIPVAQMVGKAPYVNVMKRDKLHQHIDTAGFHITERWVPDKSDVEFIIARRALD